MPRSKPRPAPASAWRAAFAGSRTHSPSFHVNCCCKVKPSAVAFPRLADSIPATARKEKRLID